MSNIVQIKVPDIGDFGSGSHRGAGVGGRHDQGRASLITVESDKASMEIPASQGGW